MKGRVGQVVVGVPERNLVVDFGKKSRGNEFGILNALSGE